MRDKRTFLLCLLILALMKLNAQNTLYSYNGVFRVALPPKLELQNSELNTIRKNSVHGEVWVNVTSEAGHITFQQKGLNAGEKVHTVNTAESSLNISTKTVTTLHLAVVIGSWLTVTCYML